MNYKKRLIKKEASPLKIVGSSQIIGNSPEETRGQEKTHMLFVNHANKFNGQSLYAICVQKLKKRILHFETNGQLMTAVVCHRCQSGKLRATPRHVAWPLHHLIS